MSGLGSRHCASRERHFACVAYDDHSIDASVCTLWSFVEQMALIPEFWRSIPHNACDCVVACNAIFTIGISGLS